MNDNQKISKLTKAKKDLSDDSGNVSEINNRVDEVVDRFNETISFDGSGSIANKLYGYKEKYQSYDTTLDNARSFIQSEINAIYRDIDRKAAEKN